MEKQTPIYELANDFSETTARSIFLTGKAGTGKTTFLKQLREKTRKQIAVVAPTGVAAINAGGVTMHSFFQLPFTPFAPTEEGRSNLIRKTKMTNMRRKVLQQLEILVIDEISMVRADVLDSVDTILRHFRYRRNEPFGGVQVIFIGDLYQLPPVVVPEEWDVISPYYKSPFFFDSLVVQEQPPIYIELDKIFRQKNANFVQMLNEVRNNRLSMKGMQLLQSRYDPDFNLSEHPDYIFLTTHNAMASRINREEMDKLEGVSRLYEARIKGEFPEKMYPNDPQLELKVGAKVMFIANDMKFPRRYYNGKIGTITYLDEKHIRVVSDEDEAEIDVELEIWENIRYNVNRQNGLIEENTLGTYTQFPLRLAWAITIHKSQGLTFDKAIIDAAYSFSSGQVYVALSRCRSLEGLVLTSPIRTESLDVEKAVVDYANQKLPLQELEEELKKSQREYDEKVVKDVFDFKFALGQATHLQGYMRKNADHFNDTGRAHVDQLRATVLAIRDVADRFQNQIHTIYINEETNLKERLKAASKYFVPLIEDAMEMTSNTPAEIFNFDVAKEYKEELKFLYTELALKKHLIKNVSKNITADDLHKVRDTFKMPHFSLKVHDAFTESEPKSNKKKKEKAPKEEAVSYVVSLNLFKSGKRLEEIAAERGFTVGTIDKHLARCVDEGLLPLDEYVEENYQIAIKELAEKGGTTTEIFAALEGNVTYEQIRAIIKRFPAKE